MSYQKVILIGNVGRDPVINFVDKHPRAAFSLATTETYIPTGATEPVKRTEWHQIVMWDKDADFAEKYIRTGSRLFIEGRLRTRMWEDRAAIKHNVTEIVVDRFELLSRNS